VYQSGIGEITLLPLGLTCQEVALVSMLTLDFS